LSIIIVVKTSFSKNRCNQSFKATIYILLIM